MMKESDEEQSIRDFIAVVQPLSEVFYNQQSFTIRSIKDKGITLQAVLKDFRKYQLEESKKKSTEEKAEESPTNSPNAITNAVTNKKKVGFVQAETAESYPTTPFPLQKSHILDSGSTVHVCNDRSRLYNLRTAEPGPGVYAGENFVETTEIGDMLLNGTSPSGETIQIPITNVHYIPIFHINIVSLDLIEEKGFSWEPKRSKSPKVSVASLQRWHQRLGHINDEAIKHAVETTRGVKIDGTSSEEIICETCQLS